MRSPYALILLLGIGITAYSQSGNSLTYQLVSDFHKAWNAEDLHTMETLLDKDAFFKSPFQLRYSRDTMMTTVLQRNPRVYKVSEIIEIHSETKGNLSWSIGKMISDIHDSAGNKTDKQWHNDYTYLFIKDENGAWKLLMLLYHE